LLVAVIRNHRKGAIAVERVGVAVAQFDPRVHSAQVALLLNGIDQGFDIRLGQLFLGDRVGHGDLNFLRSINSQLHA